MSTISRSDDPDEHDETVTPIWETIIALGEAVPVEEWDRVPTDLAANLKSYLYGRPVENKF